MVWERFCALGAPQRDVFGPDLWGMPWIHVISADFFDSISVLQYICYTLYASLVWWCGGQSVASADFSGFHGFHMDFAIYCSWKFEVHCPGGLVCTWVGSMHANSAQRFPYTSKSRSRWPVQCRSASTIHALKASMPTWRGTMWIQWKPWAKHVDS